MELTPKQLKKARKIFASEGGKARAQKTTKEQRIKWGKKGARKRWNKLSTGIVASNNE